MSLSFCLSVHVQLLFLLIDFVHLREKIDIKDVPVSKTLMILFIYVSARANMIS